MTATTPISTPSLAIPKTISFRPGSLYDDAVAFGKTLTPELNPSAVVCLGLVTLIEARGFTGTSTTKTAEILAAVAEVGEEAALNLLKRAARRRETAAA